MPTNHLMRHAYRNEEILAATAHELCLPLSHIKGFVSTLRRTDVEWDAVTRSEFLTEIELETDRLAELVDSLVAARAQGDVADPAVVVRGALHRVRGLLGDRPLRLNLPPGLPSILMHASQMERVLANLIQNAIKYSPRGTPIGISAGITAESELQFSVEDEGPGIPVEDRERIFEPFFRTQTTLESTQPGHGLGLAICQSIVLAHGGCIQVTDRPGGGARFNVILPARLRANQLESENQAKDPRNDPAKHSRGGRRAGNAQATLQQSQGQRLRCPAATDGTEALKLIEEHL